MRILFFGRYNPEYSRNRVLIMGLELQDVEILECCVVPSARFWLFRLLWRYFRMRPVYDLLFVAFPGQEVMPLARILTRKPIIFDAFTSHYEGYVQDRRTISPSSLRARWYWFIDWLSCKIATATLTDTYEHAKYFSGEFGVPQLKLLPLLLGTALISNKAEPPVDGPFVVHFHGSNIPLQGIGVIWDAVRLLLNEDIRFQMIGPFTVPPQLWGHVTYERHVPFAELSERMARAHVCLGIFGNTPKAQRVIPNKVYEALAAGRAVITADTPAIRELLDDDSALLIKANDPDALARAILTLRHDAVRRRALAQNGFIALESFASIRVVGAAVSRLCAQLVHQY